MPRRFLVGFSICSIDSAFSIRMNKAISKIRMTSSVVTKMRKFEIHSHQGLHFLRKETIDIVLDLSAVLHVVNNCSLVPLLVVGIVLETLWSTTNDIERGVAPNRRGPPNLLLGLLLVDHK